jgi:hypothetical protein
MPSEYIRDGDHCAGKMVENRDVLIGREKTNRRAAETQRKEEKKQR